MRELKDIVKIELNKEICISASGDDIGCWCDVFFCAVKNNYKGNTAMITEEEYERLKREGFIPEIFFKYFAITFCKNELIVYEKDNYIEELYASFDVTEEEKKEIRKYARHYNSGR